MPVCCCSRISSWKCWNWLCSSRACHHSRTLCKFQPFKSWKASKTRKKLYQCCKEEAWCNSSQNDLILILDTSIFRIGIFSFIRCVLYSIYWIWCTTQKKATAKNTFVRDCCFGAGKHRGALRAHRSWSPCSADISRPQDCRDSSSRPRCPRELSCWPLRLRCSTTLPLHDQNTECVHSAIQPRSSQKLIKCFNTLSS